jgi:hypothetical protein
VYAVLLGAGDLLGGAGQLYIGRAKEVLRRWSSHHRDLDRFMTVYVGNGIGLADLEATALEHAARELDPELNARRAIDTRQVGNRRFPGGGKVLPFCK